MDAPRIQYVKTDDGVSIAYWTLGQGGTPLLMSPPMGFGNLTLEWEIPKLRAWYEKMSSGRLLVRYDPRTQGMSDRGVADVSFEANEADFARIAGLIDKPMDVLAIGYQGLSGLALAARQPERVRRLVLWGVPVRGFTAAQKQQAEALFSLAEKDWNLAVETMAHALVGWSQGREAHDLATFHKASASREDTLHIWREWQEIPFQEVRSLLPAVQASTLVIDQDNVPGVDRQAGRIAASEIPNAQLLRVDEGWRALHENEQAKRAVEEFLSDGEAVSAPPAKTDQSSGTAIIFFADIVDSTALTERLGDAAFREKARELDTALRAIIGDHAGTAIDGKLVGDGVMAVFTSARQAIEAALACARAGDAALPLHLGLHAGDVIREENNVYGGAVNIAARISGLSEPGEVLVSDTVRSLARTSAGVSFEDRGDQALKGIDEPVRVWAVRGGE